MLATLPVEIIEAKPAIRRQQLRELVPLADLRVTPEGSNRVENVFGVG